jgi:hypothetical protein
VFFVSDYFGGWACFFVSIFSIGVLTAVIGDLASHFGCTIGLKDGVTAISFVALGTSLPGKYHQHIAIYHTLPFIRNRAFYFDSKFSTRNRGYKIIPV